MKPVKMDRPDVVLTPPMIEQDCDCTKVDDDKFAVGEVNPDCERCAGTGTMNAPDPNCGDLHVRVVNFTDGSKSVMSIWQPSDAERAALAAGGNLVVYVPMMPPPPFALGVISAMGVVIEE